MFDGYIVDTLTDGSLKVWQHPHYLFGALFAVPAFAGLVFCTYRTIKLKSAIGIPFVAVFALFFLGGLRSIRTGTLVLDRTTQRAMFQDPSMFGYDRYSVPLDEIRYATVRTGSHDSALMVVLKNGDRLTLGDMDQSPGKGRAAHAINNFVGYTE